MMGFDAKKDKLEIDPDFAGSIWEKLGQTEYICPSCGAHLSKSTLFGHDELICLKGCHLPDHWNKRFHEQMMAIGEGKEGEE